YRSIGALEIADAGPQLLPEAAPLDPACHSAAQFLDLAGLDEVVVCAGAERLDRRFERRVAGEHDRDGLGRTLADRPKDVEPVAVLESKVGEHEVVLPLADHRPRSCPGRARRDLVPIELEDRLDRDDDALLIVDDEDPSRLAHRSAPSPVA